MIYTVYEFVVITEEETVLEGMIDRLSDGERCGMESNVKEELR